MKTLISSLIFVSSLFASSAFAGGPGGGGFDHGNGGDMCEYRFSVIRDDLKSWILKGGAARLQLPADVTLENYVQTMLQKILLAKVSCVEEKLFIGKAEKTCINFKGYDGIEQIQCNRDLFMATKDSDQYVLVHHEYAGLAGFEVNVAETSYYEISNQIAAYLEDTIVKKLAVRPANLKLKDPFSSDICKGEPISANDAARLMADGARSELDSSGRLVGQFDLYMRQRLCRSSKPCSSWELTRAQLYHDSKFDVETVMVIPTTGAVVISPYLQNDFTIDLFSTDRGLVGQGVHLDCEELGAAEVKCSVTALPTMKPAGEATGVVTNECAAFKYRYSMPVNMYPGPGKVIDFRKGPVTGDAWLEREAVFFSRFK